MIKHHAFVIEVEAEEGIKVAKAWAEQELGMKTQSNPDVVVLKYGLLSVDDARKIFEVAAGAPFVGEHKVIIITASRAYHEAQNALLKLFEEPPEGTFLFLVMPSLGGLLPTLRSRVQILRPCLDIGGPDVALTSGRLTSQTSGAAEEFMKASKEKRSTMIKRLTSGKDEEERRELRDEAIAILNGIEEIAYKRRGDTLKQGVTSLLERGDSLRGPQGVSSLLNDIATLRGHLYDRSAPVKMILEHLSLVMPEGLSSKV